ncbi:MAG: methyltransferase [Candidatus Aminicenantes bacterium]|nr:methyltransferase [Candidatus Aminicenantes bacterium]
MNKNKQETVFDSDGLFPDAIMQTVMAFQKSRILLTAFELELFTALDGESKTSAEMAEQLGVDKRALDRLMNALCVMELLEKKGNMFANTPAAQKFLVKGGPEFLGGFYHSNHLWDTWGTLTRAVRSGKSVIERKIDDRGEEWLTAFISAMHYRASRTAPSVIAKLDLTNVSRVLDVGGGSGAFAMAFVKAKETIKAVVFDLPNVIPLTRGYIEQEGFHGKVDVVEGDYHTDDLGGGYDLVFLSAVIHSNSVEQNIKLIHKCAQALNPGGQVVIQDFIMNEARTEPGMGAMFAINMLVGTEAGDTFTEKEVKEWLTLAGLSMITRVESTMGNSLVTGRLCAPGRK